MLAPHRELPHSRCEIVPAERRALLSEKRIRNRCRGITRRAIPKQKPYTQILHRRERVRGPRSEQLERHRRRIIRHAVEVRIRRREVREAEEGLEAAVGAELDVQGHCLAGGGYCGVERGEDLRGEGGAGDGADGVAGVVGEGELVRVGEGAQGGEGGVCEEGGGGDGAVVDGGDVEVVEDCYHCWSVDALEAYMRG